ncbi:MAG: haloacid dehalogenase type II [Alphaproteobacteria bacterium]|nr:haloacid dehalogenase type II [Alphaproteobacteria bacterium]
MSLADIRYVSFDCYGTLTNFQIGDVTRDLLADRVADETMPIFLEDFTAYRFDEAMGAWNPYPDLLHRALERTCKLWNLPFRVEDAQAIVDAIPSWGPHADVPAGLARAAEKLPLVILSNASDNQIQANVDKLGAPFDRVLTAEQAQAYKPRLQAFEYMFDSLGCGPEHVMHVSSSLRYDLMSAHDLRIARRVFVERGHGPGNPAYGYDAISDIGGLAALIGA